MNLKNVSNKKELDLATAARKRLVQQCVEPNPGPQGSRHAEFKVTTQNTGGVPGLWRALSQLADKCVLCCQDCALSILVNLLHSLPPLPQRDTKFITRSPLGSKVDLQEVLPP